jgi:hypothetical protein
MSPSCLESDALTSGGGREGWETEDIAGVVLLNPLLQNYSEFLVLQVIGFSLDLRTILWSFLQDEVKVTPVYLFQTMTIPRSHILQDTGDKQQL